MGLYDALNDELNTLRTRNLDAQKGYTEVASHIHKPNIVEWLIKNAELRKHYAETLAAEIKKLGGSPTQSASLTSGVHRLWIDMKANMFDDPIALLEECHRGEHRALEDYKEALNMEGIPKHTLEILRRQEAGIEAAIKRVDSLQENYKEIVEQ